MIPHMFGLESSVVRPQWWGFSPLRSMVLETKKNPNILQCSASQHLSSPDVAKLFNALSQANTKSEVKIIRKPTHASAPSSEINEEEHAADIEKPWRRHQEG